MRKDIKIGDIVETCSLMPGIVMAIVGDDVYIRMLDVDDYDSELVTFFANCSLSHCGIVKITSNDALKRLFIGKDQLAKMYKESEFYEQYLKKIDVEYSLMTYHNED